MVQLLIYPIIKLVNIPKYVQININILIIRSCLIKEFIDHILTFQKNAAQ
jgi:hypothetical protein